MTKELAIKILTGDVLGTTEQTHEAVAMAVKALSARTDTDTISRQDAIDALERRKDKTAKGEIGSFYNTIIQHDIDVIVELPFTQPECDDTVSRKAEIDAIKKYIRGFDAIDVNFLDGLKTAIQIIEQLPHEYSNAQNTLQRVGSVECEDTVSRQAAIDTVRSYYDECDEREESIEERIEQLPSADIDLSGFSDKLWAAAYERGKAEAVRWIPCGEMPDTDRNVFIARGNSDMMTVCVGHYDNDLKQWYEDRNWFAKCLYDGLYWCEMPSLPEPYKDGEQDG